MCNKKGRPKKYDFSDHDKNLLLDFIKHYNKNLNSHHVIKYKSIWEFSLGEYEKGNFPYKTSYDFWKRKGRLGRVLVDSFNKILKEQYALSSKDQLDSVNIKKIIEQFGGNNKNILWDNLQPFDNHVKKLSEQINHLDMKFNKGQNHIEELNTMIDQLSTENEKLQNMILSFFTYSNRNNELENLISTEQSKSEIINLALEETFENPKSFFDELSYRKNQDTVSLDASNLLSIQNKIIELENNNPEYDL